MVVACGPGRIIQATDPLERQPLMSTQTLRRTTTTLVGPWLVWGSTAVMTVLILALLAMWLAPRWAPAWVATYSPFFAQVVYAVEQEAAPPAGDFTDASEVARLRLWSWNEDAAGVLRRRLEAAPSSYEGTVEAFLLEVMCSTEAIREQAEAHMSPAAAAAWADRYRENQREDLLAAGMLLLRNSQVYTQRSGVNCLGALGDRRARVDLEAHLADPDVWMVGIVRDALERLGDPAAIPALCQAMMRSKDLHPLAFLGTIGRLVEVVPEAQLVIILKHPSRFVRLWALNHLGPQRTVASLPVLVRLAAEEDESVARNARQLLIQGRSMADIDGLLGLLRSDDKQIRAGSAWVLATLGDRRAVPALLNLLVRTEGFIEPAVEDALLACLPADSDADLHAGFAHPSGTVRAWIARRMGIRRLPDAPAFLLAQVNDPEPQVRAAIYRALGELRVRDALPLLQRAMATGVVFECAAAIRALGDMGDPAYSRALSELLTARERRLRQAAAQALGALGDPAAAEALRLAQDDPEPAVREAVRQALEQLSRDQHELHTVEGQRLQEFVEPASTSTPSVPAP
ncbi:MAG TPA: HEAT repeat domain-containing protein [Planctomycetota bacterium]|nr:HEAT repeat domain-containing protein [Planctomycetota bacterium]